jgi:Tol biopolymer transport system component
MNEKTEKAIAPVILKTGNLNNRMRLGVFMLIGVMSFFMAFMLQIQGCSASNNINTKDKISSISFSPDGKKILFNRSLGEQPNLIHVYHLETGELSAYKPPEGEVWFYGRYSLDGKKITFTLVPLKPGGQYLDTNNAQIAVMDPDGKNVRKITNTTGYKRNPSFSYSGKKIIFVRSGLVWKKFESAHAGLDDVYEVDVDTGQETALTQYSFTSLMSPPIYFRDDNHFIFSSLLPSRFPGVPESEYNNKMEEMEKKYHDNRIYMIRRNDIAPLKPYVEFNKSSYYPVLSADGASFAFSAQAYKADGSGDWDRFFLYSPDGKHQCITDLRASSLTSAALSYDGKRLAMVYTPRDESASLGEKIIIYNVQDGKKRDITLPENPALIINQ